MSQVDGQIPVLLSVYDREVEAALQKVRDIESGALPRLSAEVDSTQAQAQSLIANEGQEIKGLEAGGKRVLRMLPGMREALTIQKSLKQMSAMNVMGFVNIAFLAYNIAMQAKSLYDKWKREQEEFKREVMNLRGYETQEEFTQWQNEQKQGLNASRNKTATR